MQEKQAAPKLKSITAALSEQETSALLRPGHCEKGQQEAHAQRPEARRREGLP